MIVVRFEIARCSCDNDGKVGVAAPYLEDLFLTILTVCAAELLELVDGELSRWAMVVGKGGLAGYVHSIWSSNLVGDVQRRLGLRLTGPFNSFVVWAERV